jgi:anhydro-N-acetylmuramic acid kinase
MNARKVYTVIGLMSGTSLDGVDAALVRTDGFSFVESIDFVTMPYEKNFKDKIRQCFGSHNKKNSDIIEVERQLTFSHKNAVDAVLKKSGFQSEDIDLIGFHGQTISHDPAHKFTWQIGDGALLAKQTAIDVVCDFRSNDVANGGQGAPLLPLYHFAKAFASDVEFPVVILNIGGVANITWIGPGETQILAFDTGPGNALIDDFVFQKTGKPYDNEGELAKSGRVNTSILQSWMGAPYFSMPYPKSLDRNAWDLSLLQFLETEDGAATLSSFTVASIKKAADLLPEAPKLWLVSGGGRKNNFIMESLQKELPVTVNPVEVIGWNGDALEAEGFAYLAVRSHLNLPISLPSTTGVVKPVTGGVFHQKPKA